eukprot:3232695-Pyramimonas_sp.AAC.1
MGFRGLNRISGIKSAKKKEIISSMQSAPGEHVHDRRGIADVFADFYASLYSQPTGPELDSSTPGGTEEGGTIPPFTDDELRHGLQQLKTGKAADTSGIAAEMLKYGGEALRNALRNLFNDI